MNDRLERRALRRDMSAYGWALLIYFLLLNVCVAVVMEIEVVYQGLLAVIRYDSWDSFYYGIDWDAVNGNAWGYLLACGLGVGLAGLWKGKDFFCGIWKTERQPGKLDFLCLLCVFISGQLVFQFCAVVQEWVLNHFGLSVMESMEMATIQADTLSLFLYGCLAAPVVEEILFRGVILRGLMPYGKRFAVVMSALFFGLFHGNIVQSPYAFAVGLVLGYTAVEYSIFWAMVLHMVNNLVLGDMLNRLTASLSMELASSVTWGFIGLCAVAAVVILLLRRKEVWAYHKENRIQWEHLGAFVTAPGNIVLFLVMYGTAFWMLFVY